MSEPTHAGTFLRPVGPELASALAQAADSAYAPPTFFVVARYEPAEPGATMWPFNVQRPVATYEEAAGQRDELARSDPGVEYGIFGPFRNAHAGDERAAKQASVAKLKITPQGGAVHGAPFTIPGQQFDALFYSIQAVEKFVVPYYVREYGPQYGVHLMDAFRRAPLALMGHLPWSEETIVTPASVPGTPEAGPLPGRRGGPLPAVFHLDSSGTPQARAVYPSALRQP